MDTAFPPIGGRHAGIGGENSFWPSFTDIMMVVTMIFLMATSLLVVRNWQLVAELQESIAAEQLAARVIESTTQEKLTLEERLANAEQSNSILRLRLMKKDEELADAQTRIREQDASAAALRRQNTELASTLEATRSELETTQAQLATANLEIDAVNAQYQQLAQRLAALEQDLAQQRQAGERTRAELESTRGELRVTRSELESTRGELGVARSELESTRGELNVARSDLGAARNDLGTARGELGAARDEITRLAESSASQQQSIDELRRERTLLNQEIEEYNQQLLTLKGEYETVKSKYEELIKPARTAKGKYIAEVYYIKRGSSYTISYREPGDGEFSRLSLAEVEARLAKLKQEQGENLYVKIIIPENSGLSYNEAWQFMRNLLVKYDYYYQE